MAGGRSMHVARRVRRSVHVKCAVSGPEDKRVRICNVQSPGQIGVCKVEFEKILARACFAGVFIALVLVNQIWRCLGSSLWQNLVMVVQILGGGHHQLQCLVTDWEIYQPAWCHFLFAVCLVLWRAQWRLLYVRQYTRCTPWHHLSFQCCCQCREHQFWASHTFHLRHGSVSDIPGIHGNWRMLNTSSSRERNTSSSQGQPIFFLDGPTRHGTILSCPVFVLVRIAVTQWSLSDVWWAWPQFRPHVVWLPRCSRQVFQCDHVAGKMSPLICSACSRNVLPISCRQRRHGIFSWNAPCCFEPRAMLHSPEQALNFHSHAKGWRLIRGLHI